MNKTTINIAFTQINTIDKNCSMSLSNTSIINKNVSNKRNEGFGEEAADSVNIILANQWVDDRDIVDSFSVKKSTR